MDLWLGLKGLWLGFQVGPEMVVGFVGLDLEKNYFGCMGLGWFGLKEEGRFDLKD